MFKFADKKIVIKNMKPTTKRIIESMAGWATIGFFMIWLLEIRRTAFKDSYWIIMLSVACLLIFQYLRKDREAPALMNGMEIPQRKPAVKPSVKKKKK
jgi:cell division protein FtsW (lipid II flippase)